MISRRYVLGNAALALGGALLLRPRTGFGQAGAAALEVTDLSNGLFVVQGAGCNVVALRGPDGALMVDGGLAANARALVDTVLKATGNDRVARLINTHWHPEQTGANELVGSSGGTIFAHEKTKLYVSNTVTSALFEGRLAPLPEVARPTETTRGDGMLDFGGHEIEYGYLPAAHSDSDLFVFFREHNVLAAGGVVAAKQWPLIDYHNGSWYGGRVRALQRLADLVRPDTRVVPADGPLMTGRDVMRFRDIYVELFDTMIGYMNMGLGAEDVVVRNPLAKYEPEISGAAPFLDGAYRSMQIAYFPD